MRSEAQREASRKNGAKSKGPTTPEGKDKVRFNGLVHGLRAEQVVLPGESAAEFEAERRAWFDDWRPGSQTRAVLVERAAAASWRLRRSVRVEAARLSKLACAAADRFEAGRRARLDRGLDLFGSDPAEAVRFLEADATGIDQLIAWWGRLAVALEDGPDGWDSGEYHNRLMVLLGHQVDDDPAEAGPMLRASLRLLQSNDPDAGTDPDGPLSDDEAEQTVVDLAALVDEARDGLRALRERYTDPAVLRRREVDAECVDASPEAKLQHRYEMAHDRSLRATIAQLIALDRSGADLSESEEDEEVTPPMPAAPTEPRAEAVPAPTEPEPGSAEGSEAPTEPEEEAVPPPSCKSDRNREGRTWPVVAPDGAGASS